MQQTLARERQERQAQLAEVRRRRENLVATIRPADLQVYQMLRARRGSHVVALVEGKACRECGITLPTAVVQRAREGQELTRCPNCDRILFAGE
ncbi:MAG: hypothetical protein H5T59_08990 [Anaerolineae bacterium]|nr:hypothetical protein [Anaerolineae bacterium]